MFETVDYTEENETDFNCWACKISFLAIKIFFDSKMTVLKLIEILMSFAQHYILEFRNLRG